MRMDVAAAVAALLLTMLAGFLGILWAVRWRKQTLEDSHDSHDDADAYRALLDSGEISSEEYERIRRHLADRENSSHPRDHTP